MRNLITTRVLHKDSPEYICNGRYELNKVTFITLWSFKEFYHLRNNNIVTNAEESKLMPDFLGCVYIVPDAGSYPKALAFNIEYLKLFYGV